jgi:hypothetical protein
MNAAVTAARTALAHALRCVPVAGVAASDVRYKPFVAGSNELLEHGPALLNQSMRATCVLQSPNRVLAVAAQQLHSLCKDAGIRAPKTASQLAALIVARGCCLASA